MHLRSLTGIGVARPPPGGGVNIRKSRHVIISSNQIPFYEWETHKLSTLKERHNLSKQN